MSPGRPNVTERSPPVDVEIVHWPRLLTISKTPISVAPGPSKLPTIGTLVLGVPNTKLETPRDESENDQVAVAGLNVARSTLPSLSKSPCIGMSVAVPKAVPEANQVGT